MQQALAYAADWRPDAPVRTTTEVMARPELARYVADWPRPGDVGVVAVDDDGRAVGAAWWRSFTAARPGYGFVDALTPEVSIGVIPEARGRGVGTAMLQALIDAAGACGLGALSLSVELDNPARRLYARLNFVPVAASEGSLTMVLRTP
ncbi:MAG: GNAT family N-acetyltransferase [Acidimicrobiia bacterium]|nr:GNAT family N-acetyltransferase [Acidimicrobiia bacterium]